MGNRATVIFHSRQRREYSPAITLQNYDESVERYLELLRQSRLRGDVEALAARFVGMAHVNNLSASTILGVGNLPRDFKNEPEVLERMSPGDAGLFMVESATFETRRFGVTR